MSRKVLIKLDEIVVEAELFDTITADKIIDALPIESVGSLWGDEVYFRTDISAALDETSKTVVNLGDIGFWPPSKAICIFYGKTPNSTEDEIKPASAVNIIGKVTSSIEVLKKVKEYCEVTIEKIEN